MRNFENEGNDAKNEFLQAKVTSFKNKIRQDWLKLGDLQRKNQRIRRHVSFQEGRRTQWKDGQNKGQQSKEPGCAC